MSSLLEMPLAGPVAAPPSAEALAQTAGGLRHFLDLRQCDAAVLRAIVDAAAAMKRAHRAGRRVHPHRPFDGMTLGLMLERPSTRTRVSFEVAMRQLGGDVVVLSPRDMQLGRGETVADTARVLSRFLDALVLRTDRVAKLRALAEHATIPVINGLTDASHPVQLLADILTVEEHRGPIAGQVVAWCGDGNNVAASWIEAAMRFGFILRLATPPDLRPRREVLEWAAAAMAAGLPGRVELVDDARAAVRDADCVVTDTWTSMSDDSTGRGPADNRHARLEAFRVDAGLMERAAPDALFMHCLPAHRGEEVTDEVMEGRWSVVFDEAENRLHAQKALLAWTLGGPDWQTLAAGA